METLPSTDDGVLVVVTENHPLPGEDFDQVLAKQRVSELSRDYSDLVVVALRSPYDLLEFSDVQHYLCAHSPSQKVPKLRCLSC